jgi:hypothetical protein
LGVERVLWLMGASLASKASQHNLEHLLNGGSQFFAEALSDPLVNSSGMLVAKPVGDECIYVTRQILRASGSLLPREIPKMH